MPTVVFGALLESELDSPLNVAIAISKPFLLLANWGENSKSFVAEIPTPNTNQFHRMNNAPIQANATRDGRVDRAKCREKKKRKCQEKKSFGKQYVNNGAWNNERNRKSRIYILCSSRWIYKNRLMLMHMRKKENLGSRATVDLNWIELNYVEKLMQMKSGQFAYNIEMRSDAIIATTLHHSGDFLFFWRKRITERFLVRA